MEYILYILILIELTMIILLIALSPCKRYEDISKRIHNEIKRFGKFSLNEFTYTVSHVKNEKIPPRPPH